MKYTIIYEVSYKISPNEWVRVGINQEQDDDIVPHHYSFKECKALCEKFLTQVVEEANKD